MLRGAVLGIANRRWARALATGGLGRRVALRFVAGETLDDAVEVIARLNAQGAAVSIDYLGENVIDPGQARAAGVVYLDAIERIAARGLDADVSVKLTQLGLDIDPALAYETAEQIAARAAVAGTSVTLDMEDHRTTDRTIDTALRLSGAHPGAIGIALQAALKRTPGDLERVMAAGINVRLCKGAYKEPRALAWQGRRRVAESYRSLAARLLGGDVYAMIATHDETLVDHAATEVKRRARSSTSFEFQMLYGVRRELQQRLIARGYRLRVYVPFGDQWYPYLTRRIAERPANVRFFLEALARQ